MPTEKEMIAQLISALEKNRDDCIKQTENVIKELNSRANDLTQKADEVKEFQDKKIAEIKKALMQLRGEIKCVGDPVDIKFDD